MRRVKVLLFVLILLVFYNSNDFAHAEQISSTLKQVLLIGKGGDDARVEIHADRPLTYTYYRMPGLLKVVIDLALVDPGQVLPMITSTGLISKVTVEKKDITTFSLTRVLITLETDADFSVFSDGDRSRLTISFKSKPTATAAAPVPAAQQRPASPGAVITLRVPAAENHGIGTALKTPNAAAAALTTAVVAAPQPKIIQSKFLQPVVPQNDSSRTINSIEADRDALIIKANGRIEDYKAFTLKNPGRLVIDVPMAKAPLAAKDIRLNRFGVTKARLGNYPDKIRLVFDSNSTSFPPYRVDRNHHSLAIAFPGKSVK